MEFNWFMTARTMLSDRFQSLGVKKNKLISGFRGFLFFSKFKLKNSTRKLYLNY